MRDPVLLTRRQFLRAGAAVAGASAMVACTRRGGQSGGQGEGAAGRIVAVAIHPAIGVARVGNSAESFYFGPEVPGAIPRPRDGLKDPSGAIARQAARFRLYGLNAAGLAVRELTAGDGPITWSASVANKKAFWYDFNTALDIPVATPVARRNPDVAAPDRSQLIVAADEKSITGRTATPVALGGTFGGAPVPLGELMTDEDARLVFMPGAGLGYSPTSAPLTTFSDNNGWADDTCDGPVFASIDLDGTRLTAEPAWVIVTPPNYGPGMSTGLVTAYDSSRIGWDPAAAAGGQPGVPASFATDVLPVFTRLVDMQWVNAGFLYSNGWGSEGDYLRSPTVERLADPSPANAGYRNQVFSQFRDPSYATPQPDSVPLIYGDGMSIPAQSAYQWLTVTPLQYAQLRRWAQGDFEDDRAEYGEPPESVDDLAVDEQPAALDRAGLESCLGGAYHPGIELPWTIRVPSMWVAPMRLRMRSREVEATDYGDQLTPDVTMSADGPLAGSGPGDLTRWQGVPWQSDAGSCRSGYEPQTSPVLPTFWPARVPNHVLREQDYKVVVDTGTSMEERQAAFERRYDWERFVSAPSRQQTLDNMMAGWFKLGLVTEQPGPSDRAFPSVMKVESLVGFPTEPAVAYGPTYQPEAQPESPEALNGQPPPS